MGDWFRFAIDRWPARGPARDHHAEELIFPAELDEDEQSSAFYIEYFSANEELSARTVIVKSISERNGIIYLSCYCLLRKEPRMFRADRITLLANARTGEIYDEPVRFLSALIVQDPVQEDRHEYLDRRSAKRALRDLTRPAAILLMSVARADDDLSTEERELVERLVDDGLAHLSKDIDSYDLYAVKEEFTSLVPSQHQVTRSLNLLLEKGPWPPDLPHWLSSMARADGIISPEERSAFERIVATLRRSVAKTEKSA